MAPQRQNLTLSLEKTTLRKARRLAAREGVSVSALVGRELRRLADEDQVYRRAERDALALLQEPFSMGGRIPVSPRNEWHQRP